MSFQSLLESLGYKPRPYSGRGMIGAECVGVSVVDVGTALDEILRASIRKDVADPGPVRQDSLGLNFILYWPKLKFEK